MPDSEHAEKTNSAKEHFSLAITGSPFLGGSSRAAHIQEDNTDHLGLVKGDQFRAAGQNKLALGQGREDIRVDPDGPSLAGDEDCIPTMVQQDRPTGTNLMEHQFFTAPKTPLLVVPDTAQPKPRRIKLSGQTSAR